MAGNAQLFRADDLVAVLVAAFFPAYALIRVL